AVNHISNVRLTGFYALNILLHNAPASMFFRSKD
ncbi:MAG: hypothetical protein ACI8ZT_002224, partial [Bacteroidia bacterium]